MANHHHTEEQITKFKEEFSNIDKDGSGSINIEELSTLMKSLGQNVSEDDRKHLTELFGADDNCTLNFSEFLTIMAIWKSNDFYEQMRILFPVFDKDGNGSLSKSEIQRIVGYVGLTLTDKQLDDAIKEADTNAQCRIQ